MMGACGADDDANCFDFDNWSEKRVLKWPLTRRYEFGDNREWYRGFAWISPDRRALEMKLEVDCYAGRAADERPVRFRLDGHEYMVEELLDQWYGPSDTFFKVSADDGNLYILRRETSMPDGSWHLESFRQLKHES